MTRIKSRATELLFDGGIIPATFLLPKTLKSDWNSTVKVMKVLLSSEISVISVINGYKTRVKNNFSIWIEYFVFQGLICIQNTFSSMSK